jgi:hypothetical protein
MSPSDAPLPSGPAASAESPPAPESAGGAGSAGSARSAGSAGSARSTRPRVVRPAWAWFAALDSGIVALVVLSTVDRAYDAVNSATPLPIPSRSVVRAILAATAVIHVGEGLAAARVAGRRGLPARGWGLQTLAVGFPSLLALRRALRASPARPPA